MFHVPEPSRTTTGALASTSEAGNNGAFDLESPEPGWRLTLICSDGSGMPDVPEVQWEHVSVHAYRPGPSTLRYDPSSGRQYRQAQWVTRTPTWREMTYVKDVCWDGEDVVVQFHPRRSEYVNLHRDTLHLWRKVGYEFPTPPRELVG